MEKDSGLLSTVKDEDDDNRVGAYDGPDWLTYETVFNQSRFRKTNQQRFMGLYMMELSQVSVFVLPGTEHLELLTKAFFPECTSGQVLEKVAQCCPWLPVAFGLSGGLNVSPSTLPGTRGTNQINTDGRVVMAYNYEDNDDESHAIGTKPESRFFPLEMTWKMWKTASRSCVVELSLEFDFEMRKRSSWVFGGGDFGDIDEERKEPMALSLHRSSDMLIGVKTGVTYVGKTNMQGQKDTLKLDVYYGCLQSAYVQIRNRGAGHNMNSDPHIGLMLEILGVCDGATTLSAPGESKSRADGMLVRDLSCLNRSKIYFPPTSIPFVDLAMREPKARFSCINDLSWCDFWKKHYAESLGRAKALLFLRYGLQAETPNAQNFLIECDVGKGTLVPTGKILIRDIGDLHGFTQVIWGMTKKYDGTDWNDEQCFSMQPFVEFFKRLRMHSTERLRLHWHDFSTLSKALGMTSESSILSIDPDMRAPGWARVFCVMAEWGLAHHKAYVKVLCNSLSELSQVRGIALRELFAKHPAPNRFMDIQAEFPTQLIPLIDEWKDTLNPDKVPSIKALLPESLRQYLEIWHIEDSKVFAAQRAKRLLAECEYHYAEQLFGEFVNWEEELGDLLGSYLLEDATIADIRGCVWREAQGLLEDYEPWTLPVVTRSTDQSWRRKHDSSSDDERDPSEWD